MLHDLPAWTWVNLGFLAVALVLHRLRRIYRRIRRQRQRRPLSVASLVGAEIFFNEIYARNVWGGIGGQMFSGTGSQGEAATEYVNAVCGFARSHNVRTIVDIGCGDFRIGGEIAACVPNYIGCDVSSVVIEHNRTAHARPNVTFLHLDASKDPLPDGDICLIRQVLQHLSNAEIAKIMDAGLAKYRFALVTEHHPAPIQFKSANHDMPTDADNRIPFGSGVYLDQPPFGYEIAQTLVEVSLPLAQSTRAKPQDGVPETFEHISTFVLKGIEA
jgi:SAM-dependent methyltransferase